MTFNFYVKIVGLCWLFLHKKIMRSRKRPLLNTLRTLEVVQDTGSLAAATQRSLVSRFAVSHQMKMKALRDWVGSPMIMRKGRSVVPEQIRASVWTRVCSGPFCRANEAKEIR